jgi:interferon gamma inducible protein 47
MIFIFLCILIVGVGKTTSNDYGNDDTEDFFERFRTYVERSGLNNIENYLQEFLNEWETISIHIAITGQSGTGKSTFINTMRRLRAGDPQAASVGVDETTKTIKSHQDVNNTNFVYWDLPGCGTSNFPRDTYLKTVDFNKFDLLIIMTTSRFTQNDHWLVTQAKYHGKPFFLVRNKINGDLESEQQDHPSRSEGDVIDDPIIKIN